MLGESRGQPSGLIAQELPDQNEQVKARVLAIDDSPTIIIHLRRVLEAAGYRVETLDLLVELAERLKKSTPDLIILDLHMPTLPGVPFGRLIRKFQPHEIPIIIYSSQPMQELIEAAQQLNAAAFVQKGDADSVLVDTVERVLLKQQLLRSCGTKQPERGA